MRTIPAVAVAAALFVAPILVILVSCQVEPARSPQASGPGQRVPLRAALDVVEKELGRYPESLARYRAMPHPPRTQPVPHQFAKTSAGYEVTYFLGCVTDIWMTYPTTQSLPPAYWSYYPGELALDTIAHFTTQSLQRDGITDATVSASPYGNPPIPCAHELGIFVTIDSATHPEIEQYATVHPAFVDPSHGYQSSLGASACQACTSCSQCPSLCVPLADGGPRPGPCWDPLAPKDPAWAMYLPLGLPMLNQKTVLFLDYPPVDSLTQDAGSGAGDYLANYTMCRWSRVLSAVGASVPTEYETIVDSRPIAAGGSGMDPYLPAPQVAYNSPSGGQYITPMLQLLTDPVGASGPATLPVAVFGATARQTWGQMVGGGTPAVLQVGSTPILGKSTGWISTNHPDVTSYNCCPADPYHPCTTYGGSYALVPDEQQDFVAACWMQAMGAQPAASPQGTETACAGQWMPDAGITGNNALSECMQEKLDNNDPYAVCCSWAQAWTYCQMHGNNACATLDCDVDGGPTPPPMPSETCNEMRFFLLRDGGYPQPDGGYCQRCGGCTK